MFTLKIKTFREKGNAIFWQKLFLITSLNVTIEISITIIANVFRFYLTSIQFKLLKRNSIFQCKPTIGGQIFFSEFRR